MPAQPQRRPLPRARFLLLLALGGAPVAAFGALAEGEQRSAGAPPVVVSQNSGDQAAQPQLLAPREGALDARPAVSKAREDTGPRDLSEPVDPWLAHLRSEDPRRRFDALRRLATADPLRVADEIGAYLEDTRDSDRALLQRLAAVALLGELDGVPVVHQLTRIYDEEDESVRRAAALALAKHGDDSLIERELARLGPDLSALDGGLRARAAESASALGSPRAVPVLVALLDDPNSDVRAHAVDGLWRAGDVLALPEAERLLSDPVPRVRERARRAVDALRSLRAGVGGASGH